MPTVHFDLADGSRISAKGKPGIPLMHLARDCGIEAILAECGGACCCATCHVYVDPQWINRLPEMDEDEQDMLEFAEGVNQFSRLSCQLTFCDKLDGLVVRVPESQY